MLDLFVKIFRPDFFSRWLKGKKNAVILLYHSPEKETFRQHMDYISQHYSFITLDQLIRAIKTKDWSNIPPNAIVVSFDDGHISNYHLKDIFKAYNMVPTIYLCSGVVGTDNQYWWLGLPAQTVESLKLLRNQDRLKQLAAIRSNSPAPQHEKPVALTASQIKEMSDTVDFQSHTRNHPIVTMLDDDELQEELISPISDLKEYDLNVQHFAFPNGDYSLREVEHLKKGGYASARTTDIGWTNLASDPYRLKIMGVSDNASISKLRLQISGLYGWIFHILKSGNFLGEKRIISNE